MARLQLPTYFIQELILSDIFSFTCIISESDAFSRAISIFAELAFIRASRPSPNINAAILSLITWKRNVS